MNEDAKKKILIVDDEEEAVSFLANILRREDFEVTPALTGTQALSLVKQNPPDLIILDIVLPDIDGSEVAAALAEDSATAGIPIIFLSGVIMQKGDEASGQKTGRNYILSKPTTGPEILEIIERIFVGCA